MPLRILHLTAGSDAGGLSRYLLDLSLAMRAAGHSITIAGERGAWHERFVAAQLPWLDLPLRGSFLALRQAAAALAEHLAHHPVDIIHTHYRRPTLVARRAQRQFSIPILYTVHQPRIRLFGPWRWLSDFGDHTHAPSADARQWLIDDARVPPDQVTLIPHGVDERRFPLRSDEDRSRARQALGLAADETVAVFVGRLDVPKNAGWMLDVARLARERLPRLRLVMAGDGPEMDQLKSSVQRQGLNNLTLLGDRDPLPIYQAADALLSPSQREGFLLVGLEAMSVGVPVLRTRTGGAAEMIVEGVTGRSVAVNRDQFADAATAFLSDRARLETMGIAAAAHVRENLSFSRQVNAMTALYEKIASSPATRDRTVPH